MTEKPIEYSLYILIRTDVPSMTMGKRMAQVAHAANQFAHNHQTAVGFVAWQESAYQMTLQSYLERKEENRLRPGETTPEPGGFGVTIVKSVRERDMRATVAFAQKAGYAAGITHDPSYPSSDPGHVYPLDTCAYVFGPKGELDILLYQFPLHE